MTAPVPTYEAERVVSEEDALRLIRTHFPALGCSRLTPLGVGWDNTAYLTDTGVVFRFPRRAVAVALLEAETRVLPRIATALPLPVPVPEHLALDDNALPWIFAGYAMLPGRSACAYAHDDDARARAAAPLGAFLRALHALEPADVGAPADEHMRTDFARRRPQLSEWLTELRAEGAIDDPGRWFDVFPDGPVPPGPARLVHGDLYARHILTDDTGLPTGVIDWGDVHIGDPALDVSIAWSYLPPAARPAFFAAYGDVDERTWRVAHARSIFSAVAITWYGGRVEDHDLQREGLRAMALVLET